MESLHATLNFAALISIPTLIATGITQLPFSAHSQGRNGYSIFSIYACLAVQLAHLYLLRNCLLAEWPWMHEAQLPAAAIPGPLAYFLTRLYSTGKRFQLVQDWPHLLLPIVSVGVYIVCLLRPWNVIQLESTLVCLEPFERGTQPIEVLINIGLLIYIFANAMLMRPALVRSVSHQESAVARTLLAFIGITALLQLVHLSALLMRMEGFYSVKMAMGFGITVFLFVLPLRYPDLIQNGIRLIRHEHQYQQPRLPATKSVTIGKRLGELMETGQIYRDESLTLVKLARQLGCSAHLLSEHLNTQERQNFRSYVNGWRVRAAQILIHEDHERTLLSVAFGVGFNSRSSFLRAFRQHTGLSPAAYRDRAMKRGGTRNA